jgi:hypothetical protein
MTTDKPRNRNPRSDREPPSWSRAFADHVERKRKPNGPVGFREREDD